MQRSPITIPVDDFEDRSGCMDTHDTNHIFMEDSLRLGNASEPNKYTQSTAFCMKMNVGEAYTYIYIYLSTKNSHLA